MVVGESFGPYRVLAKLGEGGMGEVYRARDTKLDRDVAIKVLPESFAADGDRLARFTREAKTLAALNHPNIAHIHGLEEGRGVRALVMEFVEGEDLLLRIERGPMPLEESLAIAKQIAEALETAHEQGIVHRDLKPANIKVRPDGTVKVLDFGLAKALSSDEWSGTSNVANSPTLTAHATQLGVILGTAAYMSPEQAKGKAVDRRADIWAFGVVLYEMLTGRRGYEAEDISETLAAVLTREVDWAALPAATPPRLRVLLRDCLARDPRQRLRDIGEARRVLDQLISGADASAALTATLPATSMPFPVWRRALPWAIAAIAVALAASVSWQSRLRPAETPRVVSRSKVALKDLSGWVSISRDGTKLAYTSTAQDRYQLVLRSMDQFEGKPIPGSEGAAFSVFSPDGQWIAFNTTTSPNTIRKIPVAGGTPITLCSGSFDRGVTWGDDDTIVFPGPTGLMRVPASGGTPQALTTVDSSQGEIAHIRPQFLPGGRRLLFTLTSGGPDSSQFAVLDLQTGSYQTVAKGGDNGRYSPTGHLTFVRDKTLFAVPFDLDRITATGSEVPVIEHVSILGPPGTGDYSFSETGVLVYSESQMGSEGTVLMWADRKGVFQQIPGQIQRQWATGRLSPDGRVVANGIVDAKGTDIWVAELGRGIITRLTFGGVNDSPIWTPDGRRVIYRGSKDGKSGLYSVAADGSGPPELVIATETSATPTSFTPDGKTLLYSQVVDGRARVFVLPPAASGAERQPHLLRESNGSDSQAQISPDGKWVAFTSTETGAQEVYVQPFPGPGARVRISTDGGFSPRWSADGREVFYWASAGGFSTLATVNFRSSATPVVDAPRPLFRSMAGSTWDVTPDSNRFLVEGFPAAQTGSVLATVTDWFEELRRRAPAKR